MANVFVSHRGMDSALAERLAAQIRDAGHQVWIDVWELTVGVSIVERINAGLSGASHLVLCYSSSGVDTAWMKREWQSALALQLAAKNIKIIPVRLTGGSPPAILADVMYLDLVAGWDEGVKRLLAELERDQTKKEKG
jgi:TIR domain